MFFFLKEKRLKLGTGGGGGGVDGSMSKYYSLLHVPNALLIELIVLMYLK